MDTRALGSTVHPIVWLMVDATNHVIPKLGLIPTVTVSKDGSPFGSPAGTVGEIGNGWYELVGNAADRNVLGELIIHAEAIGADPADVRITIVGFDPFADVAIIRAETEDIQARVPTTLVGGRMRSHVEAMDADVIGAAQIAAGAITAVESPPLANLDAAISSRAVPGDAMDLVTDAVDVSSLAASAVAEIDAGLSLTHGTGNWEGSSAAAVADAVWDEAKAGHVAPGSFGEEVQSHATPAEVKAQADQALVDYDAATGADVATRAAPGDAMDLVTDAVDADALAADAVAEIQANLAMAAAVAAVQADTDDIQARLPATLVGGRMRSHVEAMDADVIGAAQIAAGAITVVEAPALDAAVSSRAAPGAAMTLTPAERATLAGVCDSELSAAHGAGSWEGESSPGVVAAAVWNEAQLAHTIAGSFGDAVRRILALQKENYFIDEMAYNSRGLMLSGRIRIFPDKATALAATAGGSGQGEIATYSFTTTAITGQTERAATARSVRDA